MMGQPTLVQVLFKIEKNTDDKYNIVKLIQTKNGGASKARNLGVEMANGSHVAFLDADDIWEVHFLEEIHSLINEFPNAVAYTTAYQKIVNGNTFLNPKVNIDINLSKNILLY